VDDTVPPAGCRTNVAMSVLATTAAYTLLVATEGAQVRAAQQLRYQVFAEELGATLHATEPGLDVDDLDAFCDHLVIRVEDTGEVVGTYRMLPPDRAAAAGRLYSDGEFDLTGLAPLRPALVETGRSCVAAEHRTGAVINLMWAGIARYMLLSGHRWLAGCASVPEPDATGVWTRLQATHLVPPAWRVTPHRPWPVDGPAQGATLPPLLRGYLRLGAWVCGPPAHDPDFGVADLFVLLSLERVDQRYLRHFLGQSGLGRSGLGQSGLGQDGPGQT
jgi:putative hemolysin